MTTATKTDTDFLWHVFVAACESGVHGIGCWAHFDRYEHHDGDNRENAIAGIVDRETDDISRHTITLETIRKGLDVIDQGDWQAEVDKGMHRSYRAQIHIARLALDAGAIDGPLADMIVQCGLFGEVIYG